VTAIFSRSFSRMFS